MEHYGRRRGFKSWFVEPYRQVKLGLIFIVLNFLFAGLFIGIFGYYIWDIYQSLAAYFSLTFDQSTEILSKFLIPVYAGAVLVLVFIVISILLSVRYTHRIYGPLVSIHRFLDECLQGHPRQQLVLRESDQLKELANKLNQIVSLSAKNPDKINLNELCDYIDASLAGSNSATLYLKEGDPFLPLAERIKLLIKRCERIEGR